MTNLKRGWFLVVLASTCIAVAGCPGSSGERLCTVTGEVLEGGQPAGGDSGESGLTVEFFPLDEQGNVQTGTPSYAFMVRGDGTFVADGFDGDGIPAGKYRVAVYRMGMSEGGEEDAGKAKFGRENSPFEYDITGDQEITINLDQAP